MRNKKKHYTHAVCIASGPSLTADDCQKVKKWQEESPDTRLVITTNNSYRIAPFSDILYACDRKWWREYYEQVINSFKGNLSTHCDFSPVERALCKDYKNSGANAICLAVWHGCKTVYLVGYDCSIKNGYHWHGKHEGKLTNCKSIKDWPDIFKRLSLEMVGIRIVNLSRYSELECFERGEIDEWL